MERFDMAKLKSHIDSMNRGIVHNEKGYYTISVLSDKQRETVVDMVGRVFYANLLSMMNMRRVSNIALDDKANGQSKGATIAKYIKAHMERETEDDVFYVSMVYIYCNWRVWQEYERCRDDARCYQDICDTIDDYVFDNWSKQHIKEFCGATD